MNSIDLQCRCGKVVGIVQPVTRSLGSRLICSCRSCQSFAAWLNREADVLDEFGGTEILQLPLSHVQIHQGREHLKSMRLSPKGTLRWFTDCCNTPVGNTVSAKVPFIGLVHSFMHGDYESVTGPVRAYVQTQDARIQPDHPNQASGFPFSVTLRLIGNILRWKLQGKGRPSAFFDDAGKPVATPVLADKPTARTQS